MTSPFMQFIDSNGDPLASGKVYTYESGTTTPKATYTDQGAGTPHANPVILDAAGRAQIWISGSYKFVVTDSDDVTIETTDVVSSFATGSTGVDDILTNFTEDTVAAGDSIIFSDASDSDATKRDTVQGILDLVSAGGITEASQQATTSGTSIDFTSIPAGTKRIYVMLDNVSTNGTDELYLQIGDAGGVETSGYDAMTVGSTEANSTRADVFTAAFGLLDPAQGAAANTYTGIVVLSRMDSGTFKWTCEGAIMKDGTTDGGYNVTGVKSLSAELDRVRLTTASGTDTFDAGNANIAYE